MDRQPEINKEDLYHLYHIEELSQRDIAKHFSVGKTTIQRRMKKYNISTRKSNREKMGCHRLENSNGYEIFKTYDKSSEKYHIVKIHRLNAVAWFGIDHVKNMDVHHKNSCKIDNRENNIELISRAEHTKLHNPVQFRKSY